VSLFSSYFADDYCISHRNNTSVTFFYINNTFSSTSKLLTSNMYCWSCETLVITYWTHLANIRINFTFPETRMTVLPDAENHTIVSSFVWTKHRNVTEGRTDRRTDGQKWSGYYSGLHWPAMRTRCKNLLNYLKPSDLPWAESCPVFPTISLPSLD